MSITRLDIRIDEDLKSKAEKASALLGLKSLTQYIARIMDERSSEILSEYEQLPVSDDLFEQFARACDQAAEPNEALRSAADYARKRGFQGSCESTFVELDKTLHDRETFDCLTEKARPLQEKYGLSSLVKNVAMKGCFFQ